MHYDFQTISLPPILNLRNYWHRQGKYLLFLFANERWSDLFKTSLGPQKWLQVSYAFRAQAGLYSFLQFLHHVDLSWVIFWYQILDFLIGYKMKFWKSVPHWKCFLLIRAVAAWRDLLVSWSRSGEYGWGNGLITRVWCGMGISEMRVYRKLCSGRSSWFLPEERPGIVGGVGIGLLQKPLAPRSLLIRASLANSWGKCAGSNSVLGSVVSSLYPGQHSPLEPDSLTAKWRAVKSQ